MWRNNPKKIQMSMSLIVDVRGSFEDIELLRVYITNIAVIETGMLVLKCSFLKNKVAWNKNNIKELTGKNQIQAIYR